MVLPDEGEPRAEWLAQRRGHDFRPDTARVAQGYRQTGTHAHPPEVQPPRTSTSVARRSLSM